MLASRGEVWEEGFSNRLRIRSATQHGKCNTCIKHKVILRRIGGENELARRAQSQMWGMHLRQQFQDRQFYWNNRALSRAGHDVNGDRIICLIMDSMDRSKWAIPRSEVLGSKSFQGMRRPVMDCTGIIVHGHALNVAFCEPHIPKGANWTIELLSIVFNKLTLMGLDLRCYKVILQADNASKECKSNGVIRFLSWLTARRRIRAARLCFCMAGHNHEDIDQMFSLLGSFLQTQRELHTSQQFLSAITTYVANPAVRPQEHHRDVFKVDAVRAWTLGTKSGVNNLIIMSIWTCSSLSVFMRAFGQFAIIINCTWFDVFNQRATNRSHPLSHPLSAFRVGGLSQWPGTLLC